MLTEPHFGWWKTDIGGYVPDIWFYDCIDNTSKSHYNNDELIAILLSTTPKLYSDFLKFYGAIGPRNKCTYFTSQEDCEMFLEILKYLYEEIYVNGKSWLSVTLNLLQDINNVTTESETREDMFVGVEKTYWNQQSWQQTPRDINTTKEDVKNINSGHFTENPFKPGRSKKPTHYTIL